MLDSKTYQKAHTLINEYGSSDSALKVILKAIVSLQKNDEDSEVIRGWIKVGDAIKELNDLESGHVTIH